MYTWKNLNSWIAQNTKPQSVTLSILAYDICILSRINGTSKNVMAFFFIKSAVSEIIGNKNERRLSFWTGDVSSHTQLYVWLLDYCHLIKYFSNLGGRRKLCFGSVAFDFPLPRRYFVPKIHSLRKSHQKSKCWLATK